jgi:hypothetical protein
MPAAAKRIGIMFTLSHFNMQSYLDRNKDVKVPVVWWVESALCLSGEASRDLSWAEIGRV